MKRKNIFSCLIIAFCLMIGAQKVAAQIEQSVYLNIGLPVGEMNDDAKLAPGTYVLGVDNAGKEAVIGFGLGYRVSYIFPIDNFGSVNPFFNVDLHWSRVSSDIRDQLDVLGGSACNYFNIPIMLGVNYRYPINDVITPFAEIGVGYDIMKITSEGKKNHATLPYYKYKTGGQIAWQIGLGSYFGSHVSAGLTYYGLGKHTVNYNSKSQGAPTVNNQLRKVGILALRVGFHF